MYEIKKIGKVFTSKPVGTGPSSFGKKEFAGAAVWQRLRTTVLDSAANGTGRVVIFGATKLPTRSEDGDEVISRNVGKSSHPYTSVCPKKIELNPVERAYSDTISR